MDFVPGPHRRPIGLAADSAQQAQRQQQRDSAYFLQGPPAPGSLYRRGQVLARAWCPTPRPQCRGRVRGVESGPKIRGPVRLFLDFRQLLPPLGPARPAARDRTHDPWAPSPCLRRDLISATELSRVDRCGGRGWTGLGRLCQHPSWPGDPSGTLPVESRTPTACVAKRGEQTPGIGAATARATVHRGRHHRAQDP